MTDVSDPSPETGAANAPVELGSYELLDRLGTGALGEAFRARDTIHGRTVVIKRVPAALSADLERAVALQSAAEPLEAISHPGVAMLYECGLEDGRIFLALEYVSGDRLDQLIGGRPLNPRRAVEIAIDVADALAALHQAGLVHGDVRPANIIVSSRGHAKIIDAGLARFTAGGMLRATAGSRLGALPETAVATLRYLSPEEAAGERTDARSDVFSLGCVLHEMLTGQAPFDRPTADAIVLATLQASPPPANAQVAAVPIDLSRICSRALAKSMDRRYPSAAAMAEDLRGVASLLDEDLDDAPAVELPESGRGRNIIIGIALFVVATLVAWWAWLAIAGLF
jgi:eukaryotic-like serine/threonine-protein kinase